MSKSYQHLLRSGDIEKRSTRFSHPWNPLSEVAYTHMSAEAGLTRSGVSLMRVAPGKESFAYHLHHREEEWIYILSGRGMALIDGAEYEMGPGDFVAFPTPSVAHNMRNPFDKDLVYLSGGEHQECEVADFPELGRRMVRIGEEITVYDLADGRPLRVIELRMPQPVEYQGDRLPASYANFYIGNHVVLMPAFNDPADEPNRALLARCFPGREVVPIDCTDLVLGLGTFHCLTQQVPVFK